MRVKICGLTNVEDARRAASLGAWALGFIFYDKSPRYIAPEVARKIAAALPAGPLTVGVFVNASPDFVRDTLARSGLVAAQLHGDEDAAYAASLGVPVIKAFRPRGRSDLESIRAFSGAEMLLVDAAVEGAYGGTGRVADWEAAAELAAEGRKLLLSGGLHAGNVAEAIRRVRPFAVDISSGVESSPGRKSPEKLEAFFAALGAVQGESL